MLKRLATLSSPDDTEGFSQSLREIAPSVGAARLMVCERTASGELRVWCDLQASLGPRGPLGSWPDTDVNTRALEGRLVQLPGVLALPLRASNRIVGVLTLFNGDERRPWADEHVRRAIALADVLAHALLHLQDRRDVRETADFSRAVLASASGDVAVLDRMASSLAVNASWIEAMSHRNPTARARRRNGAARGGQAAARRAGRGSTRADATPCSTANAPTGDVELQLGGAARPTLVGGAHPAVEPAARAARCSTHLEVTPRKRARGRSAAPSSRARARQHDVGDGRARGGGRARAQPAAHRRPEQRPGGAAHDDGAGSPRSARSARFSTTSSSRTSAPATSSSASAGCCERSSSTGRARCQRADPRRHPAARQPGGARGRDGRPTLAPDLPRVRGDRVQLQQVVLNLLQNAIHASVANESARRPVGVDRHEGLCDGGRRSDRPRLGARHSRREPRSDLRSVLHHQARRPRRWACPSAVRSSSSIAASSRPPTTRPAAPSSRSRCPPKGLPHELPQSGLVLRRRRRRSCRHGRWAACSSPQASRRSVFTSAAAFLAGPANDRPGLRRPRSADAGGERPRAAAGDHRRKRARGRLHDRPRRRAHLGRSHEGRRRGLPHQAGGRRAPCSRPSRARSSAAPRHMPPAASVAHSSSGWPASPRASVRSAR